MSWLPDAHCRERQRLHSWRVTAFRSAHRLCTLSCKKKDSSGCHLLPVGKKGRKKPAAFLQVASLMTVTSRLFLPLSTHLTVHNHSSSPDRQHWRRSSIANAIQQIHFINFNYIPTENEWSENIKHLPSRSFTFFIQ